MSHRPAAVQNRSEARNPGPAPATIRSVVRDSGRTAVLLRPSERLHVGSALHLAAPLARFATGRFPRTILVQDIGCGGQRHGRAGLSDATLDRLACIAFDSSSTVAIGSRVPSIARLAAIVATEVRFDAFGRGADSRSWFANVLLAAGLLATRSTHVDVEAGDADDLALTRRLVACLDKELPGACPVPVPASSGLPRFLSLDGTGPMGTTARGTIFITDTPDEVARKVRHARTDGRPYFAPGDEMSPEVANLFLLTHALSGEPASALVRRLAGRGYSALKEELIAAANSWLAPVQARREALLASDDVLVERIALGSAALELSAAELADTLSRRPELLAA